MKSSVENQPRNIDTASGLIRPLSTLTLHGVSLVPFILFGADLDTREDVEGLKGYFG